MANTKILINFRNKKVLHTKTSPGNEKYDHLIAIGYVCVGTFKPTKNDFFWNSPYFEPDDKYHKGKPE